MRQRDALVEKNQRIESLHNQLQKTNDNLEKTVAQRTSALKEQNRRLEEYAFMNANDLKGPVARVLGIINLMEMDNLKEDEPLLLAHLKKASIELDQITRSISDTLHSGIVAYEHGDEKKRTSLLGLNEYRLSEMAIFNMPLLGFKQSYSKNNFS